MRLTDRGEKVADAAAFIFCILAVCAWSTIAYILNQNGF